MKKRTFVIVFVAYVAAVSVAYVAQRAWSSGLPFDAAVWSDEAVSTRNGARLRMADWLVESKSLLSQTRSEVVSQLGEPPPTGYFRDWDLVYYLGPERGFMPIDSEWLVMHLGKDHRVTECRIVRD